LNAQDGKGGAALKLEGCWPAVTEEKRGAVVWVGAFPYTPAKGNS
jgi:hypothetical protein